MDLHWFVVKMLGLTCLSTFRMVNVADLFDPCFFGLLTSDSNMLVQDGNILDFRFFFFCNLYFLSFNFKNYIYPRWWSAYQVTMEEHILISYWWSWMDSEIHNEGFKHHSSSVMAKDLLNSCESAGFSL